MEGLGLRPQQANLVPAGRRPPKTRLLRVPFSADAEESRRPKDLHRLPQERRYTRGRVRPPMRALSLSHSVEGTQAWVTHPQEMTRQRITLWSIPHSSNLPSPIGLPPAECYAVVRHRIAQDLTQAIVPPAPQKNFDETQHVE